MLKSIVKMLWVEKNDHFYVRGEEFVQKTILCYVTF